MLFPPPQGTAAQERVHSVSQHPKVTRGFPMHAHKGKGHVSASGFPQYRDLNKYNEDLLQHSRGASLASGSCLIRALQPWGVCRAGSNGRPGCSDDNPSRILICISSWSLVSLPVPLHGTERLASGSRRYRWFPMSLCPAVCPCPSARCKVWLGQAMPFCCVFVSRFVG